MDPTEQTFFRKLDLWGNLFVGVVCVGLYAIIDGHYPLGAFFTFSGLVGVIVVAIKEPIPMVRYAAMLLLTLTCIFLVTDIYLKLTVKPSVVPTTPLAVSVSGTSDVPREAFQVTVPMDLDMPYEAFCTTDWGSPCFPKDKEDKRIILSFNLPAPQDGGQVQWQAKAIPLLKAYRDQVGVIADRDKSIKALGTQIKKFASGTDTAKASDEGKAVPSPPISVSATSQIDRLQQQLAQANSQIAALQSQRHPAIASIQSAGPISWNGSFGFAQGTDANGEAIFSAIIFSGTNISSAPVQLSTAYIASELTGAQETLQVNMGGGPEQLAAIAEINQIPPNAPIELWVPFKPALHASDFLAQWGKLRFHAEYGGIKYDKTFDEQTITNYLSRYPNAHIGPHITRKSGH
jgi:hypothetical protein